MIRFTYIALLAYCLSFLVSACNRTSVVSSELISAETVSTGKATRSEELLASTRTIRGHMAFLANDLLEGRDAGSKGEALSALYISTSFQRLGLEPMGDGGSFIQPVPLRSAQLELDSVHFQISRQGKHKVFQNGNDIFVRGSLAEESIDVSAKTVFAGHGVQAPEIGLSDYNGLDVEGKTVVVLGGPPPFLPSAEAAHYGSTAVKQRMAADAGAVGLILLWTPANEAQIGFDLLKTFLSQPTMTWVSPSGEVKDVATQIQLRALIRGTAAQALFSGTKQSAKAVIDAGQNGPVPGFSLESTVSLALATQHDDSLRSANIAGFLHGSDPVLKDEVVVVTAHYDHVGLCRPFESRDRICNGALDNALGTAAMMDVARRFTQGSGRPKRSVLFLAVGAEEKGLLGSDYFANFPTIENKKIVANINMDGGLPFYDFSDVIAFGAEQSTLGETLAKAVAPMGLTVGPDPFPELSIFTRSDQYSFVKKGVPALFLYNGFTDLEGQNVGREIWDQVLAENYHQPSDDLSLPIKYDYAAKYAEVFYRVTCETANEDIAPQWYHESVFGSLFAANAQKAPRR